MASFLLSSICHRSKIHLLGQDRDPKCSWDILEPNIAFITIPGTRRAYWIRPWQKSSQWLVFPASSNSQLKFGIDFDGFCSLSLISLIVRLLLYSSWTNGNFRICSFKALHFFTKVTKYLYDFQFSFRNRARLDILPRFLFFVQQIVT